MELVSLCKNAKAAKYELNRLDTEKKNAALKKAAEYIKAAAAEIIEANKTDLENADKKGMSPALKDRLKLDEKRIDGICEGLLQVAELEDPVGEVLDEFERPNGLKIKKVRVPLGVVGIIYESRPNVTADAFALTFKAGNVVILKGGSDAINSNIAITKVLRKALSDSGISEDAISLIESTDRETTKAFMQMKDYVDVLIPRGSAGLIRSVVENSKIPVIETGAGNCHIFIDETADAEMATKIIINAKTQRLGVCNTCESLVVHEKALDRVMKKVAEALKEKNVDIRADEEARPVLDCNAATEEDFATEYLDLIISVKTVKNIDEAIEHINKYSTHHSEAIITGDYANAEKFLKEIDSACVYVNASTRFTDGFEFGFGAEIGISTQMLHARGPMGLRELTSYKYRISGNGQVRG
ncbi:MAG: glutamate-5-semialdehyde dehydrogenase [Lachnospiraceae bacterium]|nr:glutamate-5-semialdehyde dehydrogenase [Lachnospiraceae bacterium]